MFSRVLKRSNLDDFAFLFLILFASVILTFLIPAGEYDRNLVGHIIPGSYHAQTKTYEWLSQALFAIPKGVEQSIELILLLFICSFVVALLETAGWVEGIVLRMVKRFSNNPFLLSFIIFVLLALGGSTLGIGEELIPLVPIFILLCHRLGYDTFFALFLLYVAPVIGFTGATINPFNVFIAQKIAGLPINSGLGLRIVFFVILLAIALLYLYFTAPKHRIKKDTSLPEPLHVNQEFSPELRLTTLLIILLYTGMMIGVSLYDWSLNEMNLFYLLMGITVLLVNRLSASVIWKAARQSFEKIWPSILILGITRAILIIFHDGMVFDTLIFHSANMLSGVSQTFAVQGMYVFQNILGLIIPSASGQAMATIPFQAPISNLLGIPLQISVLTIQFDTILELINPLSGSLLLTLRLSGLSYQKWCRFCMPLFAILYVVTSLFLIFALKIGYQ